MKWSTRLFAGCLALLALPLYASQLAVEGGSLVNNASITADQTTLGTGATICGSGRFQGALTAAGTLSPGNGGTGTLSIDGSLVWLAGARYACDATSDTNLDRVTVLGPVSGPCTVVMNALPGVFPLHQVIVEGSGASAYGQVAPDNTWTWRLETTGTLNLAVTHLRGDTDGDGLPDWWEWDHFGGRSNCTWYADEDNDGNNDHEEYVANTDPWAEESLFMLTTVHFGTPAGDVLRWSTAPGRTYHILQHTDLWRTNCLTIDTVSSYSQPETEWTNTAAGGDRLFYEVSVEEKTP